MKPPSGLNRRGLRGSEKSHALHGLHSLGLVLTRAEARVIAYLVCGKGSACGFNCQRAFLPPPLEARRPQRHNRARPILRPPMYFVAWTPSSKPDAKACNHQRIHNSWNSNLRPDAKPCSDYLMEIHNHVLHGHPRYTAGRKFSPYDQFRLCIPKPQKVNGCGSAETRLQLHESNVNKKIDKVKQTLPTFSLPQCSISSVLS